MTDTRSTNQLKMSQIETSHNADSIDSQEPVAATKKVKSRRPASRYTARLETFDDLVARDPQERSLTIGVCQIRRSDSSD